VRDVVGAGENAWHRKVCNGRLTLREAQKAELEIIQMKRPTNAPTIRP
jgi:hypothetical protein